MRRNRFIMSLRWELRSLLKFPFPEVLLAFFTYMVFLPPSGSFGITLPQERLSWEEIARSMAFHTIRETAQFSSPAYLPLGLFASIFATLSFAYEIENGLLKVYLSHPLSRRDVFSSKLLSSFLVIFVTFSASLLTYAFFRIPENSIYLILSADLLLKILLVAASECLFVISIAVSFSLFTGKVSLSMVGSSAIVYLIQMLSETGDIEFLPPTAFREQVSFLFRKTPSPPNFLTLSVTPLISTLLIVLSYLYFSRRLEIG